MRVLFARTDPSGTHHRPEAVVLGGQQNGLGVIRSLARAGLRVRVVSADRHDIATASRHVRTSQVPTFDGEPFVEAMLRLRMDMPQGGVLICADDRPLLTLSQYRDQLSPHFNFLLPSHHLLSELNRKDRFFQLAQGSGSPVPPTLILRRHRDLEELSELTPPLCVKPNFRTLAYDSSFRKAYRVESHADARQLCEQILDITEVIVQEWIEGANDAIYFSLCCFGPSGQAVFTGRKGRSWPPQIGYTASCWPAPDDVAKELESLTIQFFQHVGFTHGLASMEFKRDERSGRFLMVEPTVARADRQVEIATLCGINLCHIAYCDAAELPRPSMRYDPAHVWRDEFTDFPAARALGTQCSYPSGYRIHNAHWRWDDPAPALLLAADYAARALRRITVQRPSHPSRPIEPPRETVQSP